MTDQELRDLVADLILSQKETDRMIKETDRQMKETDRQMKETDRRLHETDRQIRELGKQIGGLGNKFGDFTEGMAIPSLMEILAKRFGAEQIVESKRVRKGAEEMELDLIGTTNGRTRTVVAGEVKSVLNQRELDKFLRNLRRFFEFFPVYQGWKLYGVLAAVESSKEMDDSTVAAGVGLARMHGDIFRLKVPRHFQPKDFSPKS